MLENLQIAAPCPARWEDMKGDDRKRFCGLCSLNVYNLSGMTRNEAEALVARAEGRVCVRMFRRPDGTVLTQDCPVGLREVVRQARRRVALVAGWLLAAVGLGGCPDRPKATTRLTPTGEPVVDVDTDCILGAIAIDESATPVTPKQGG